MDSSYHATLSPLSAPELEPLTFTLTLTLAPPAESSISLPQSLLDRLLAEEGKEAPPARLRLRISPCEMPHFRSEIELASISQPWPGAYSLQFAHRGLVKGRYRIHLCLSSLENEAQDAPEEEWLLLGYPSEQGQALAGPPLGITEQIIPGVKWRHQYRTAW
jgi:hypothetical protein